MVGKIKMYVKIHLVDPVFSKDDNGVNVWKRLHNFEDFWPNNSG